MSKQQSWIIAGALVLSAAAWRIINWHYGIAPNLELVTASTLVAAAFMSRRTSLVVPLGAMVASDLVIGNSPILLFTWSAFALIGLAGRMLRRLEARPAKMLLASVGAGAASSIFFFLYTNFGHWLLGYGGERTWAGLLHVYVLGLPFYRTMLLGNLIFVPAYFTVALYAPAAGKWLVSRLQEVPLKTQA